MNLLLDVLLTDSWSMALRKVALATAAARPDIKFTIDGMRQLTQWHPEHSRERCRWYVRRLRHDENNLDLLWLMLAASPTQPWTIGFMDRLGDAYAKMEGELTPPEHGLVSEAMKRLERWECLSNGFPAIHDDPFKAVLEKEWLRALAAKKDRDREDRAAAAKAAVADRNAPTSIRDLVTVDEGDVEAVQDRQQRDTAGVQVIAGEPKLTLPHKALIGVPTPLTMTPDVRELRDLLRIEFPHAHAAVDLMLGDLRPGEPLRFRPFMLVGEPGSGKSRLIRRLAELLEAPIRRYDGAASADNAFGGTPKRWSTAMPCFPLTAIAETKTANVIVMIDEVDKAGPGFFNGSLHQALMPFLERETSRSYPDVGFEIEVDLSHICYAMTANDDSHLPKPLKDRLRVVKVPSPGVEHIESLARSILRDLAVEMALPAAFLAPLAPDELAVVAKAWGDNGSVRKLQKILRGTVTARDETAVRH